MSPQQHSSTCVDRCHRKHVTEGGTRVEGACGQQRVQRKSGIGRSVGWLSEAGESWKRDTLNPALGSLGSEAELQAGSLTHL